MYNNENDAHNLLGCTAVFDIQLRTRQYIPEDSELHTRYRENLKSHNEHDDGPVGLKCVVR
jgi:hypothetical protein